MKYPKLFAPMQVGTLTFRNRLLSGPNMMCALNPDGSPTDYMVGYYEEKAKGGVAQVTVGDTPVEERALPPPGIPFSVRRRYRNGRRWPVPLHSMVRLPPLSSTTADESPIPQSPDSDGWAH